jgi:hypothetical protein
MKKTIQLITIVATTFLVGCSTSKLTDKAYYGIMDREGLVPFMPPQGNPNHANDWNKYGPGAIVDNKSYETNKRASFLLGADGVANALSPDQATDYHLLNNKTVSGNNLDGSGGYSLQAVGDIEAKLNLADVTNIEVTFGNTKISQPVEIDHFQSIVRNSHISKQTCDGIRRKQLDIVTAVVFTDSLKFTFSKRTDAGGEAKVTITDKDLGSLTYKGYKAVDGSVLVSSPTFLYYRPLKNARDFIPRGR